MVAVACDAASTGDADKAAMQASAAEVKRMVIV
jgi:hypothetical protein